MIAIWKHNFLEVGLQCDCSVKKTQRFRLFFPPSHSPPLYDIRNNKKQPIYISTPLLFSPLDKKSFSPHHVSLTCTCGGLRAEEKERERRGGKGVSTPERGQESGLGVRGQEEIPSVDREPVIILI